MNAFKSLIVGSLLLVGCAQTPKVVVPSEPVVQAVPVVPSEPKPKVEAVLPSLELSDAWLYEMLLTEIAAQRGYKDLAVEGSLDIAQQTRDPRLAKRAAQLALQSGDLQKSITAFKLWQELEPDAALAPRLLSSLLLRGGMLEESRVEFVKVLKADESNAGQIFMQIYPLVMSYPDPVAALKLVRDLTSPYPQVAQAHWLVAQLAQKAADLPLALDEARRAHSLQPEWDLPVLLEAQLLHQQDPAQSLALLKKHLAEHADAHVIRLQYARELLEQKQYQAARDMFQYLSAESPDNIQLAFAVALITVELKDLPGAQAQLSQALIRGGKDQDAVEYYLGQLGEAGEDTDAAMLHYRAVQGGEYLFSAQLRVVYLLDKRGKQDEARQYLRHIGADNIQQRIQLVLIEAQLLSQSQQLSKADEVLRRGLEKLPNQPELLYEAAMVSERLGQHKASERLLRRLIKLKPDHAHAYNALGYGMLERNVRIPEALVLVEKALQLAPEDIAIMDSVGWGYYRAGRLDESVKMLRRAFAGNPDPEIAAHLGEVLWARGDKEEAAKVWQDSLAAHPANGPLQAVMKRFMP